MTDIGDLDPNAFAAWLSASREAEWQLSVLLQRAGIPPSDVLVMIADLRSELGLDVVVAAYGQHHVERRLSEAARSGIPPAAAVVMEIDDGGAELVAWLWPDLVVELEGRPEGTTPILLLDRDGDATMTWATCEIRQQD